MPQAVTPANSSVRQRPRPSRATRVRRSALAFRQSLYATAAALEARAAAIPEDPAVQRLWSLGAWSVVRHGETGAITPVDNCVVWCAVLAAMVVGVAVAYFTVPVLANEAVFQARCPVNPATGVECNGAPNACVDGECMCGRPQWSGTACTENACAVLGGFDPATNTPCFGFGLCSPLMQWYDVPKPCAQGGWYSTACVAYTRQWSATWAAARNNATLLQQYPQLAGVPMCLCTVGTRDGPACELEGCPTGDNGEVCSGFGNTTVGTFRNGTRNGNGCQAQYVFNLLDPVQQVNLSTDALITIQTDYLQNFSRPIAGELLSWNTSAIINKGAIVDGFTTSFKCYCDETKRFGVVCNQGVCPDDENGLACSGNGLVTKGAGYLPLTTNPPLGAVGCTPICVPGASQCLNNATQCGPSEHADMYDVTQWCTVPRPAPTVSLTGAVWRCADGTLVSAPASSTSARLLGYTPAALDASAYDAMRASSRLNLSDPLGFQQAQAVYLAQGFTTTNASEALVARQANFTAQSPFAWWLIALRNPSSIGTAQVSVSFAGGAPKLAAVPPLGSATLWDTPQLSLSDVLGAGFAQPLEPVVLTVRAYTASRVQLFPAPFLDTVPTQWQTVRLASQTTGEFVTVAVQGYTAEFFGGALSSLSQSQWVALLQPQNTYLGSAASQLAPRVPSVTCIDQISQCAWAFDVASGEATSGGWVARYDPTSQTWTPRQPLSIVGQRWADAPTSSWTQIRGVLVGQNYLPITAATARGTGLAPNAWLAQIVVQTPEWVLTIETTAPVVADALELVTSSALQRPYTCLPAFLGQTPNRTDQNILWQQQRTRTSEFNLLVGTHVAVTRALQGFALWDRGVVAQSSNAVTTVALIQTGELVAVPTDTAAVLTPWEYRSGLDFSNPWVLPGRCPTGYRTATQAFERVLNETDGACVLWYPDPVASPNGAWWQANCTFPEHNLTCACSSASAAAQCDCGAFVIDDAFEAAMWSALVASQSACACTTLNSTSSTNTTARVTLPVFSTLGVAPERSLLGLVAPGCWSPSGVDGLDPYFNASVSVQYTAACSADNATTHIALWFSEDAPYPAMVYVRGVPSGNTTWATAIVSPGGTPISSLGVQIQYTASQNSAAAQNAASVFPTQPWVSGPSFGAQPNVWIAARFEPTIVHRLLVGISQAALVFASPLVGEVPVVLAVEVLSATTQQWVRIANHTTFASQLHGPDVFVVPVPQDAAIQGTRVAATFGMSVLSLVPLVDQACACANASLVAGAQLAANPLVVVNSQTAVAGALARTSRISDIPGQTCVCTDTCAFARDFACQDTTQYALNRGWVWTTVTQEALTAQYTLDQLYGAPGSFADFAVFNNNVTVWLVSGANQSQPSQQNFVDTYNALWPVPASLGAQNYFVNATGDGRDAVFTLGFGYAVAGFSGTHFFNGVVFSILGNTSTPGWVDPLRSNTTLLSPPNTLCAAGTDCSDCGCSFRTHAVDPGLQCEPDAFEAQVLELYQTGQVPSDARVLVEYLNHGARAFVQLSPLPRLDVAWSSAACDGQVCSPFQERCADGACRSSCSFVTEWTCPGNGCVAAETNLNVKYCVCQPGYNGVRCEYYVSSPPNLYDYTADWYNVGSCYAVPGLKIQPSLTDFREYNLPPSLQQMVADNRKFRPRTFTNQLCTLADGVTVVNCTGDVGMYNIKPKFAGGPPYVRYCETPSGIQITTDVPPLVTGPYGQLLMLEDCVRTRDLQGNVLAWQAFPSPNNGSVEYRWNSSTLYEATWDEACVRCPNYQAASDVGVCAVNPIKPCNGQGTCLSDGRCECTPPWVTYMYTTQWTKFISTPYTDPTNWNEPLSNAWRVGNGAACMTLNCNLTDCSTPKACFPGTPSLKFADALVSCGLLGANAQTQLILNPLSGKRVSTVGMCAPTVDACQVGSLLQPELVCSGHGEPFVVAYTNPPQYACHCGDPGSSTGLLAGNGTYWDSAVAPWLETWELNKNGWGGRRCNQYYCTSVGTQQKPTFVRFDAQNFNQAYVSLGVPIAGKWRASTTCGDDAYMTADPDESPEWERCCAGETLLERCVLQPCNVAGNIQCLSPAQCVPQGGAPLVYECSRHGRRLADGTCACDYSRASGTGYYESFANYTDPNCFGVIQCPTVDGRVCNQPDSKDVTTFLDDVYSPGFESQIEQYMLHVGLSASNQSIFTNAMPNIQYTAQTLVTAVYSAASTLNLSLAELRACVDLWPGDNPADPQAMLPYNPAVIGGLFASYKWPYTFVDAFVNATLPLQYNVTRFPNRWSQVVQIDGQQNVTLSISFPTARTVYYVRVWCAVFAYDANKNPGYPVQLVIKDNRTGEVVCPKTPVAGVPPALTAFAGTYPDGESLGNLTGWGWTTLTCVQQYSPLNYANYNPIDNNNNCGTPGSFQSTTAQCLGWRQSVCATVGGTYLALSSRNQLYGCIAGECCVPGTAGFFSGTTSSIVLQAVGGRVGVQSLVVMGYTNQTLPPVPVLTQEWVARTGGSPAALACYPNPDYPAVQFASQAEDQSTYLPGDISQTGFSPVTSSQGVLADPLCAPQTKATWNQAAQLCQASGGFLAAPPTDAETEQPNSVDMAAPLLTGDVCPPPTPTTPPGVATRPLYPAAFVAARNTAAPPDPPLSDVLLDQCTNVGSFFNSPLYFTQVQGPPQLVVSVPVSDWTSDGGTGVSRALGLPTSQPNAALSLPWWKYFAQYRQTVPLNPCWIGTEQTSASPEQGSDAYVEQRLCTNNVGALAPLYPAPPTFTAAVAYPVAPKYTPVTLWSAVKPATQAMVTAVQPTADLNVGMNGWRSGSTFVDPVGPFGNPTNLNTNNWTMPETQTAFIRMFSSTDCTFDSTLGSNTPPTQMMQSWASVGPANQDPAFDWTTSAWAFGNENPQLTAWLQYSNIPAQAVPDNTQDYTNPQGIAGGLDVRTLSGNFAVRSFQLSGTNAPLLKIFNSDGSLAVLGPTIDWAQYPYAPGNSEPGLSYNIKATLRAYDPAKQRRLPEYDASVTFTAAGNPSDLSDVTISWTGGLTARTMRDSTVCFTVPSVTPRERTDPVPPLYNSFYPQPAPKPGTSSMHWSGDQTSGQWAIDPLSINYTVQFDVLNRWRSEIVQMGVAPQGSEGTLSISPARSYTNGWLTEEYTCQALDVRVTREIVPGGVLSTFAGYSHYDSYQTNWLVTKTPRTSGSLESCLVPPAEQCAIKWNVLFEWNSLGNPGQSAFPDVQTVLSGDIELPQGSVANNNCFQVYGNQVLSAPSCGYFVETERPLIITFGEGAVLQQPAGLLGIVPNDGLVPLWKLGAVNPGSASFATVLSLYKAYAWHSTALTLQNEATTWTYGDCVAILQQGVEPNSGSTLQGLFVQYPCTVPLNYLCTRDFTKYAGLPGHSGFWCGANVRTTGAPRLNTTCFESFPQTDPNNNPSGFAALAAVEAGTVGNFVAQPIAFDSLRAYFSSNNISLIWNLKGARNLLVQSFSSQPGATTRGVAPDYATWINFALDKAWPVDCGTQTSIATGQTARYWAQSSAYCSPDAAQKPAPQLTVAQLATALQGISASTTDATARFLAQCGVLVSTLQFVTQDIQGYATPDFELAFVVIASQSVGGLALAPLQATFEVYNTGKNPSMLVFQPNEAYTASGWVRASAASVGTSVLVRVWIAPITYSYAAPSTKYVVGSASILAASTTAPDDVPYQYAFVVPDDGVTYQVLGFDVVNTSTVQSTMWFSDVVVASAATVSACRTLAAQLPKFGFETAHVSPAPNNFCPMTREDLIVCDGSCVIGQCRCDASQCGPACEATCVATATGKHGAGGFGAFGLVVDPLGVVQTTAQVDQYSELRGSYEFTDLDGVKHAASKVFDPAQVLYTRSKQLTSSYETIVRTENAWVTQPYVGVTAGLTPGITNTYDAVTSAINAAGGVLPSFVNPDQALQYDEASRAQGFPLFVGYQQNPQDGLWYATAQSLPMVPDALNTTQVPLPVVCPQAPTYAPTPWPPAVCSEINVLNLAFNQTQKPDTDGTFLFASSGSYVYTAPTTSTLFLRGATSLWIWYRISASPGPGQPTVSTPCTFASAALVDSAQETLAVYTCTSASPTVLINYQNTLVGEVALFTNAQAGAAVACVFYPCE